MVSFKMIISLSGDARWVRLAARDFLSLAIAMFIAYGTTVGSFYQTHNDGITLKYITPVEWVDTYTLPYTYCMLLHREL